ncbi:MAG: hypothetical protein V4629_09745, partial [Pseudomonadota bacterium]
GSAGLFRMRLWENHSVFGKYLPHIDFPGCCTLIRLLTYVFIGSAGLFRMRIRENHSAFGT